MALLKSIMTDSGVASSYWSIHDVVWTKESKKTSCMMRGFYSSDTKNMDSLAIKEYDFVSDEPMNRAELYVKIKDNPDFSESIDA